MMNILILLAHPKPGSFNHAVAEKAADYFRKNGNTVLFHDLYAEGFNPVLPAGEENLPEEQLPENIKHYLKELRTADGVVIVHPNWWGSPPAILRGWIERVIRTNSCYNFTADGVKSHIAGKTVQIFSTSNTPEDIELNVYGDPVEVFWKTVVWGTLAAESFERRNFGPVVLSTPEQRAGWLAEIETTLERRFRR